MTSRIQLKRGKAAFWTDENPILHEGEPGYETDTRKWKVGDGTTHWRELPYMDADTLDPVDDQALYDHVHSATPHPVYDDGPSLVLLYENKKV